MLAGGEDGADVGAEAALPLLLTQAGALLGAPSGLLGGHRTQYVRVHGTERLRRQRDVGRERDGALLVRPDAIVAMRVTAPAPDPARLLTDVLDQVLAHPVAVPST
ncbi:hypothetical protein GCM10009760_32040 [Kitasatospora kazusensis]|uniref:Uncharacterized protein n=1 Tax=Kitasatospora kazusensis TaxID=407974 RepID=A0ABP5LFL3_9ACTN